ncbi:MAG: prepilin-type N-terminal cleavage/methylation domain-containing protein, partial [Planctomycetaceae bacterium]
MKCLRRYGQRSRRDTALRPGYTLIEMLIAVSLMVVLLTAVWGLLSMYSTLQTTGAEATAEQQLVRSVMQLIRNDLSKVPLPAADTAPALSDPFAAFDGAVADQGS